MAKKIEKIGAPRIYDSTIIKKISNIKIINLLIFLNLNVKKLTVLW